MNGGSITRRPVQPLAAACLLACLGVVAKASTPSADAFLLIPVDAREIGLGQATVALVNDATAFHRNPAGLGMIRGFDAAASYTRLFAGVGSHQMLSGGLQVGRAFRVGLSWVRLGVDDIPIYPSLATFTTPQEREAHAAQGAAGSFGYAQNAFFFTVARLQATQVDLGWQYLTLPMEVPVGITVKYLTASAGDTISGSGIGVDLGAQLRFPLGRALDNTALGNASLGLTLMDLGRTHMTWDTPTKRRDTQSMRLIIGAAYEQPLPLIRSSVIATYTRHGRNSWGLEYSFVDQLFLRLGRDPIAENGLSFGAGIAWRDLRLDYALQRHELGATHRVSLHFRH